MNAPFSRQEEKDISIEEKLRALYELQSVVSDIDKIKTLRGELPLEVQDLEDEIAGLKTRLKNLDEEIRNLDTAINNKKIAIKDSQALITKYTEQQNNVRNNREFDSLSKEVEFQNLKSTFEKRIRNLLLIWPRKKMPSHFRQVAERTVDDLDRKKKSSKNYGRNQN
jgi:predicted  nucleic acid-binding Zn-ribbon protein